MNGWKAYRHSDVEAGEYRLERCCDCVHCTDALAQLNALAAEHKRRGQAAAEAERVHRELAAMPKRRDVGPARSRHRVGRAGLGR
jgi:hypothetical protein